MGILVAMNVYVIRSSKLKLDKSFFSSSILGIATSIRANCSSIGFLVISTFGGFGIITTDFHANYQTPLRIVSIINRYTPVDQYIIRLQSRALLIYSQIISRKNNRFLQTIGSHKEKVRLLKTLELLIESGRALMSNETIDR